MTEIKAPRRQRAYEVVAADISALIQQKYEIGERLPAERELATRFGVSRPTVREALLRLSLAGLVEIKNNSGVYVTGRQAQTFTQETGMGPFENLEARLLIEPELAALAASRATEALLVQLADAIAMMRWEYSQGNEAVVGDHRFHLAIAGASGNTTLVNIVDSLWSSQLESEIWNEIHRQMPMRDYWKTWLDDHEKVFEAIKAANATAARKSMSKHIKNIHTILLRESSPKTKAKQVSKVAGS